MCNIRTYIVARRPCQIRRVRPIGRHGRIDRARLLLTPARFFRYWSYNHITTVTPTRPNNLTISWEPNLFFFFFFLLLISTRSRPVEYRSVFPTRRSHTWPFFYDDNTSSLWLLLLLLLSPHSPRGRWDVVVKSSRTHHTRCSRSSPTRYTP